MCAGTREIYRSIRGGSEGVLLSHLDWERQRPLLEERHLQNHL